MQIESIISTMITVQSNLLSISPLATVLIIDFLVVHFIVMTSRKQNNLFICALGAAALAVVIMLTVMGNKL